MRPDRAQDLPFHPFDPRQRGGEGDRRRDDRLDDAGTHPGDPGIFPDLDDEPFNLPAEERESA